MLDPLVHSINVCSKIDIRIKLSLKEMVLCFYLTEIAKEFLHNLERKPSYFSHIILCVNKYE